MFEWTKHLDSIGDDVQRLQGLVRRAIERETDPGLREHMQQLNELMTHSFDKIKETLPAAEAHLNKGIADAQAALPEMEKNIDAARQAVDAAAQAATTAPAPPPIVPFDPKLGLQLRDELLKRFSPTRPEQTTTAGEVAAMTSAEFDSGEPAPPPPPKSKTEPPRRKPKDAKSSDENWSFDG